MGKNHRRAIATMLVGACGYLVACSGASSTEQPNPSETPASPSGPPATEGPTPTTPGSGNASSNPAPSQGACHGAIDTQFGTNGYRRLPSSLADLGQGLAVEPDGKLLLSGNTSPVMGLKGTGRIVRLSADGALDTTFGKDGSASLALGPGNMLVQADGKIVVQGVYPGPTQIARLAADGALDTTFGSGGYVNLPTSTWAQPIGQRSGGAVVLAGSAPMTTTLPGGTTTTDAQIVIAQLKQSGLPDSTFGTSGYRTTKPMDGGSSGADYGVLEPDGHVVVAGTGFYYENHSLLARYTSDGHLDSTFGSGGTIVVADRQAGGLVRQASGAFVVAQNEVPLGAVEVVRYKANGTIDPTFGTNGTSIVATNTTTAGSQVFSITKILRLPDDRLLVIGPRYQAQVGAPPLFSVLVARLTADGALDTSFGDGGRLVLTTPPGTTFSGIFKADLHADGTLVVSVLGSSNKTPTLDLLHVCP